MSPARKRRAGALAAAVLAAALALTGCSGDGRVVEGVVTAVDGDLVEVRSFELALPDGGRLVLVPGDGVRFDDGLPLSHLQEHLVSARKVEVRYTELDDGTLVATEVRDADG